MVNTMETTYVMIKPDGVRGLVSEIIGRFERKGLKLVGLSHGTNRRNRPFSLRRPQNVPSSRASSNSSLRPVVCGLGRC